MALARGEAGFPCPARGCPCSPGKALTTPQSHSTPSSLAGKDTEVLQDPGVVAFEIEGSEEPRAISALGHAGLGWYSEVARRPGTGQGPRSAGLLHQTPGEVALSVADLLK